MTTWTFWAPKLERISCRPWNCEKTMAQASRAARSPSWAPLLVVACTAFLAPSSGSAAVARIEVHPFQSATLSDEEFLTGQKGKPVVIAGELRIPKPGNERLPTVILLHGSAGIGGNVEDWVQFLNSMGVATFVIDSFTARGIASTVNDQDQLGRLNMIVDAYRALELLAGHPRVDRDRIALMGFSRGGEATLRASVKRFQRMHGPTSEAFALYIVFYSGCGTRYLGDEDLVDRPLRMFHGDADDYQAVAECRAYVDRLRRAGKDVRLTEYVGAQHVFDGASFKAPMKIPQAQNWSHCRIVEAAEGRVVNGETKKPFTFKDPCVEHGATVAYDSQAHAQAQRAVAELVSSVLEVK